MQAVQIDRAVVTPETGVDSARPSPANPAVDAFIARVWSIEGIHGVSRFGDHGVRVNVSERLSAIGTAVYDLEDEVCGLYPDADLDVWVSEAP